MRTDLPENQALIAQAKMVELDAGDMLFFHCRLFHAAGRNETDTLKCSLVFSYHDELNRANPGTRSAVYPSIRGAGVRVRDMDETTRLFRAAMTDVARLNVAPKPAKPRAAPTLSQRARRENAEVEQSNRRSIPTT